MSDDLLPPAPPPAPPPLEPPPLEPPPTHPLAFLLGIGAGVVGVGVAGLLVSLAVLSGTREQRGGLLLLALGSAGLMLAVHLWRRLRPDSARVAFGRGAVVGAAFVLLLVATCGGCLMHG